MLSKMTKFKSSRIIALIIALILAFSSISLSVYAVTDSEKAEYNKKIEENRDYLVVFHKEYFINFEGIVLKYNNCF